MLAEPRQHFGVGCLESQYHAGEHLSDGVWAELGQQRFQAARGCDSQAVEVGVEAVIEFVEVLDVVVRGAQGIVAQDGEEAGFFGVLVY